MNFKILIALVLLNCVYTQPILNQLSKQPVNQRLLDNLRAYNIMTNQYSMMNTINPINRIPSPLADMASMNGAGMNGLGSINGGGLPGGFGGFPSGLPVNAGGLGSFPGGFPSGLGGVPMNGGGFPAGFAGLPLNGFGLPMNAGGFPAGFAGGLPLTGAGLGGLGGMNGLGMSGLGFNGQGMDRALLTMKGSAPIGLPTGGSYDDRKNMRNNLINLAGSKSKSS